MRDWASMPKAELHLHLEGAIPLPTLWELIEQHGGHETIQTPAQLADWFTYRDFAHFIEIWTWMIAFLRSYDDFTHVAESVARHLASQNIVYAETFFSPSDFHHLDSQRLTIAIRTGLDRVPAVDMPLIVDLVRDRGPDGAAGTLAAITEIADEARVIGIGIGGHEAEFPPEQFAEVYRTARNMGFHLTAHAGEAAGPGSVWGAINALDVERIGHGVRAAEDPALVDYLVEHQIPLEVCPTSNIRTAVVADWDGHPARRLIEAGVMVTINTDDPALFDSSLAGEYEVLQDRFGLDEDTIRRISLAAIEASWAPQETKTGLAASLDAWWDIPA